MTTTEEKEFVIREVGDVKLTSNGDRYVTCRTDLGPVAFWGSAEDERNIRLIEQLAVPFRVRVGSIASRWSQHVLWVPQAARIQLVRNGGAGKKEDDREGSARDSGDTGQEGQGDSSPAPRPFDPFDVLGVPKEASLAAIKDAYRDLIKQYHPDQVARLGQELRDLAHRKTQEINRAYELLVGEKK